jgi:hypothetical protein
MAVLVRGGSRYAFRLRACGVSELLWSEWRFRFISGAMMIVMLAIGMPGPRTRDLAWEDISR